MVHLQALVFAKRDDASAIRRLPRGGHHLHDLAGLFRRAEARRLAFGDALHEVGKLGDERILGRAGARSLRPSLLYKRKKCEAYSRSWMLVPTRNVYSSAPSVPKTRMRVVKGQASGIKELASMLAWACG